MEKFSRIYSFRESSAHAGVSNYYRLKLNPPDKSGMVRGELYEESQVWGTVDEYYYKRTRVVTGRHTVDKIMTMEGDGASFSVRCVGDTIHCDVSGRFETWGQE